MEGLTSSTVKWLQVAIRTPMSLALVWHSLMKVGNCRTHLAFKGDRRRRATPGRSAK